MGVRWARAGCTVLVMDKVGHGERRQHPFRTAADYDGDFRPSRQDYYFRYNVGMQLHLVGESLVGWMAGDLMRGVDVLLARPGVDRERIVLLGAVAGGGDPAAVAGALDPRIAAVVPFNFGGPQPESEYPLPEDAEESFNYAGGGSWESTRNLRLSARDGFLPWVIVGSIAPRRLVYAHEFSWDRPRDPVWRRLEAIYGHSAAADRLGFAHGHGLLSGEPPEASHCNNIGPAHLRMIDPLLAAWFGIRVPEEQAEPEVAAEDLLCRPEEAADEIALTPVHRLADALASEQVAAMEARLAGRPADQQRRLLKEAWGPLLGEIAPYEIPAAQRRAMERAGEVRVEKFLLPGPRAICLPVLLLLPPGGDERLPAVVAVAQEGKAAFLARRSEWLAALLAEGVAVCLPDLRGTGETRPDDDRARRSEATAVSSTELMLGQTLVGSRLADLHSVVEWLRRRNEIDPDRIALAGDTFAALNGSASGPADELERPLDVDQPPLAEPLGSLVVLLATLYDERVAAVSARGGLASLRSLLQSPFLHFPHDALVPGALAAGDLPLLVASLSGRPVAASGLVDGLNRPVVDAAFRRVAAIQADPLSDAESAAWLIQSLD
jgi:cephalosporin-C deacetylase-like acetyl esterase